MAKSSKTTAPETELFSTEFYSSGIGDIERSLHSWHGYLMPKTSVVSTLLLPVRFVKIGKLE
jgi:hypothetical protein